MSGDDHGTINAAGEDRCTGMIGDVRCTLAAGHWHWWHTHDSTHKALWKTRTTMESCRHSSLSGIDAAPLDDPTKLWRCHECAQVCDQSGNVVSGGDVEVSR